MVKWLAVFSTPDAGKVVPRVLSIAGEEVSSPDYYHPGRSRRTEGQHLFKYTLSGEGAISNADGEHLVPEGSGLLCKVNDPDICYYYRPGETRTWDFVYVTFSGASATCWADEIIARHGPIHSVPASSVVIQRILAFAEVEHRQQLIPPAWGAELVTSLLLTLEAANDTGPKESSSSRIVSRVQELVSENIESDISVKQLADLAGISREHLTRIFTRQYGTPPHQYILTERMKYAGYLLRHIDRSIKEIAYSLGFASASHFTRSFKRVMGTTPMQFRLRGTRHTD